MSSELESPDPWSDLELNILSEMSHNHQQNFFEAVVVVVVTFHGVATIFEMWVTLNVPGVM